MIRLEQWPYTRKEPLADLYENADQSLCLVQLPLPLSISETRNYLRAVRTESVSGRAFICCAVYADSELIGKIEASRDEEGEAELDLILKRQYAGRGYGTEALRQFLALLKEKDWHQRMTAYVNRDNIAMIRILEKNGFARTREFTADVMVPTDGKYVMKTIRGYEYLRDEDSRTVMA